MEVFIPMPNIEGYLYKPIIFENQKPEEWIPINPIIGQDLIDKYFVSDYGRIFSVAHNKILSQELSNVGYYRVHLLTKNNINKARHVSVHRLVLSSFNPVPNMNNLIVNHIDGNKTNNKLSNLEWTDFKGNTYHAIRTGLQSGWKTGGDCSWSTITLEQADQIGYLISTRQFNRSEIARIIGCSRDVVINIANGSAWRYVYKKYRLVKYLNRTRSYFDDYQKVLILEYIKNNIHKYNPGTDVMNEYRDFCLDMVAQLFNIYDMKRDMYIDLLDTIWDYQGITGI